MSGVNKAIIVGFVGQAPEINSVLRLLQFPRAPISRPGVDLAHQVVPGASRFNVVSIERERHWREFLRMVEGADLGGAGCTPGGTRFCQNIIPRIDLRPML